MSGFNNGKKEITTICEYCGKEFHPRTKKARFCSGSCGNNFRYKNDPNARLKISLSHNSDAHKLGYKKQSETLKQKYFDGEINVWNKGLRAQNDERIRLGSEKQAKALREKSETDEEYHNFLIKNAIKGGEKAGYINSKRLKGKTYEELYGKSKTENIKNNHIEYIHLGITSCSRCGCILTENNIYLYGRTKKKRRLCKECTKIIIRENNRKTNLKLYAKLFDALGTKCVRCGFSNPRALQIDHINGKTALEKEKRRGSLHTIYRLSLDEIRARYQLLCANCNWIKRYENNEDVADFMNSAKIKLLTDKNNIK